eukprot:7263873-Pyramimonas_sp.AAC.1
MITGYRQQRDSGRGGGKHRSSVVSLVSLRARLKVKNYNTRGIFKVCCTSFDQRRRPRAPTLK